MTPTLPFESLPYYPASEPSRRAAQKALRDAANLADAIFAWIAERGPWGATEDEVAAAFELQRCTSSGRMADLKDRGMIADNFTRRRTRSGAEAAVFTAQPLERHHTPRRQPADRRRYFVLRLDLADHQLEAVGPFRAEALREAAFEALAAKAGPAVLYRLDFDPAGDLRVHAPATLTSQAPPPPPSRPPAGCLFNPNLSATEAGL